MIGWLRQCADWTKRVLAWLYEANLLWLAVLAVPTVMALAYIILGAWEPRIRIAGTCLQLLGLATVARGLRDTRKLFSQPSLFQLAQNWLRRFPTFYRDIRIVTGTGHLQAGGATVTGFGTVTSSPKASLEDRIAMLEENLKQAHVAIQETQRRIDEEARNQANALQSERHYRKTGDEQTKKLLQEAMAGGLHLEAIGVFWLLIGITLASASIEISRWLTGS